MIYLTYKYIQGDIKEMTVRRAIPTDAKRINDLLYQVAKIHADGRPDIFKAATKKYSDDELIKIIECDTTPIFVADEDGYVLGYAFCVCKTIENNILLQDRKMLYIDDLCIDETARGKHIGKSIYEYVVAFAKERGFDDITLNVWSFNEGAKRFYESCGMTPQRIIMEQKLKEK